MRSDWSPEELISWWTLEEADWRLLANKTGATRLGFAVLLRFFELEGRFPADADEVPAAVVDYLLIWSHINPYGTFHIDMNTHLDLGPGSPHAKAA